MAPYCKGYIIVYKNKSGETCRLAVAAALTAGLFLSSCTSQNERAVSRSLPLDVPPALEQARSVHEIAVHRGLVALQQGELDKASDAFNRALSLNPRESRYHLLNALTYHLQGSQGDSAAFDLAREGYQLAIQFDPSSWLAHYLKGRLHIELQEYAQAKQSLAEAVALNADDADAIMSLAYAAYRDFDPELAAAMIRRLDETGALVGETALQNAAMIMAAVNDHESAKRYYDKLAQLSDNRKLDYVQGRFDDWNYLYRNADQNPQNQGGLIKAQWGAGGGGNSWGASAASGGDTGGGDTSAENAKMVVVDVVIIRTEETLGTSQGINLLNGLKIQFGSQSQPAWGKTENETTTLSVNSFGSSTTINNTDTITKALTVPALTYSLNIFNTRSQRNEILARPTIIAMADQQSEFFSGVELNAAAVATGSQGGQSVSIQKEVGVKLGVTPKFLDDGRINLRVKAERTFLKTPSSDINFTFKVETSKTQVNSNVVMRYGETLILSGLSEKESEKGRDGVPLLQDVPIMQYLFSEKQTKDFQKSVLILITPRPTEYVYQPENARIEYEKGLSEDERPIANLRARYSDWFKPYPNWASVFHHMQQNSLYREFRTGDVELEQWQDMQHLQDRLKQTLNFLWY
ncbi:MAG: tetratricopeptide repeat protein [Pseudomonadales bacterium]|nr:tetratricopeptide repeat protein [Pseudomonadales bacterium]